MPLYLKDKMVSGISLGVPGKSAYEQAKEGGYTGTEEEFAEILANAATKDYVDEAIGEIPTPDVSGQIDTHNTDSSAHADIRTALNGKAPAGYGLGSNIGLGVPDCNTAIKSGWYYTGGGTSNGPVVNGVEQLYLSMLVSAREEFVDQIVFGHYQGNHRIWRRYSVDTGATWTDWVRLDDNAPAGYGLGAQTGREISNCDEATLNGWYKVVNGTNIPSGANTHGWMEVSSRDIGDDRRQDYYTSDSEPKHYYRYAVDSAWGAWRCADITYGTTDLNAGSSPLATGQLHFVYE